MSLQDPMSTMLGDANAQRLKDFMRTKIKVIVKPEISTLIVANLNYSASVSEI